MASWAAASLRTKETRRPLLPVPLVRDVALPLHGLVERPRSSIFDRFAFYIGLRVPVPDSDLLGFQLETIALVAHILLLRGPRHRGHPRVRRAAAARPLRSVRRRSRSTGSPARIRSSFPDHLDELVEAVVGRAHARPSPRGARVRVDGVGPAQPPPDDRGRLGRLRSLRGGGRGRARGTVDGRVDSPVERVWDVTIDGGRFWLALDDFGLGVSLDARDARADAMIDAIRWRLTRDPGDCMRRELAPAASNETMTITQTRLRPRRARPGSLERVLPRRPRASRSTRWRPAGSSTSATAAGSWRASAPMRSRRAISATTPTSRTSRSTTSRRTTRARSRRRRRITKPLRDEPWGMREFGLRTADGHRIMIGTDEATQTSSDATRSRARRTAPRLARLH